MTQELRSLLADAGASHLTEVLDQAIRESGLIPDGGVVGTFNYPFEAPIEVLALVARFRGGIAYTRVFGDDVAREICSVDHEGRSYIFEANRLAGSFRSLQYIGDPLELTVNATAGRFTKPPATPNDKTTWVFTAQTSPSTFIPTGLEVVITPTAGGRSINAAQQQYLIDTISQYVPYKFVDFRITITNPITSILYMGSFSIGHTVVSIGGL